MKRCNPCRKEVIRWACKCFFGSQNGFRGQSARAALLTSQHRDLHGELANPPADSSWRLRKAIGEWRSALFIKILLLLGCGAWAVDTQLTVAVGEFEGNGVSAGDVNILADRLRSECMNTGVLRVMERSQMDAILKEQVFQQSGACTSSECQLQLGQLLGVDRMIVGTVGLLGGDLFTVSARMLDVASGEILMTVSEDYKGAISGMLSDVIPRVAVKIADKVRSERRRALLVGRRGDLFVETATPGATILVDSKVAGKSPLTLLGVAAGEHRIEARSSAMYGAIEVMVQPDDLLRVRVPMDTGYGALKVFSIPSGAMVFLDNRGIGNTPLKIDSVPMGSALLRIEMPGYMPVEKKLEIHYGEIVTVMDSLHLAATLKLSVKPTGSLVFVGEDTLPVRDPANIVLMEGMYKVRVQKDDYETWERDIAVQAGKTEHQTVRLEPLYGLLSVTSNERSAFAQLNGRDIGMVPLIDQRVIPGKYKLQVAADGCDTATSEIQIERGKQLVMNMPLKSLFGKVRVSASEEGAQLSLDDSAYSGSLPMTVERIVPGSHVLAIGQYGFNTIRDTLQVIAGEMLERDYALQRSTQWLDSMAQVERIKIRQHRGRIVRNTSLIVLACGGLLAATEALLMAYHKDKAQTALADYQARTADFESPKRDYAEAVDDYDQAKKWRNAGFAILGAGLVGVGISFAF